MRSKLLPKFPKLNKFIVIKSRMNHKCLIFPGLHKHISFNVYNNIKIQDMLCNTKDIVIFYNNVHLTLLYVIAVLVLC